MSQSRSPLLPLDYAAIAFVVIIYGVNNAAAKVATQSIPPLTMGALRFLIAGVCLIPFIKPPFPNPKSLLVLALAGGPIHFGLVYLGFSLAHDLGPFAISLQLWAPLSALFGWWLLGEKPTPAVMLGLAIAFAGVAYMTADPRALRDWVAILIGVAASAAWAVTTVMARRTTSVGPLKMQGLMALAAGILLGLGSAVFDRDPIGAITHASGLVWACVLFAAFASSLGATCVLFWLLQRREAGQVTPYLLLAPVLTLAIGAGAMGDHLSAQILAGALATLVGVALVALDERRLKRAAARQALAQLSE
jgi:O-acetylserine/cysteine efflux transporter